IPIRADLAAEISSWLDAKLHRARRHAGERGEPIPSALPADAPLFNVPKGLIKAFDLDLVLAGLARWETRDGKRVINKRDTRGRTLDVHALRHTFATHLSRGGVSLTTAQAAMRHSTPTLTANRYTDPKMLEVARALDALPSLPLTAG